MDNGYAQNTFLIEVDTKNKKLKLLKNGEIIKEYNILVGRHLNSAPKGMWRIIKKLLSHKEFGGYFLGLNTPYRLYGIHKGTSSSETNRQKKEEGIKISPHEARELYSTVPLGTAVIIY